MHAMHRGDIRENAKLVVEAEAIKVEIDALEAAANDKGSE